MLILHLGRETCRLKQPFSIPNKTGRVQRLNLQRGKCRVNIDKQPFVQECCVAIFNQRRLVRANQPVMFGVEDRVNRGQTNVFIAAPVARDEMRVQVFIVIGQRVLVVGDQIRGVDHAVKIDVGQVKRVDDRIAIRICQRPADQG